MRASCEFIFFVMRSTVHQASHYTWRRFIGFHPFHTRHTRQNSFWRTPQKPLTYTQWAIRIRTHGGAYTDTQGSCVLCTIQYISMCIHCVKCTFKRFFFIFVYTQCLGYRQQRHINSNSRTICLCVYQKKNTPEVYTYKKYSYFNNRTFVFVFINFLFDSGCFVWVPKLRRCVRQQIGTATLLYIQ